MNHTTKSASDNLDRQILKARDFPIDQIVDFNRCGFANCPAHDEKTPSLKLYPETNTAYCFGCNRRFDSIGLAMEVLGIGFIEAVKKLSGGVA